jgi:hypothetical protein
VRFLVFLSVLLTGNASALQPAGQAAIPAADERGNYLFRWTDEQGAARQYLLVLPDMIAPRISVTLRRSDAVGFVYRYAIANEKSAQRRVSSCMVDVMMPARVVATPAGWESGQPSGIAPRAQWFKVGFVDRVLGIPDGLPPGTAVVGFELASVNLPGVTEFRCHGDMNGLPPDLPPSITQRVESLLTVDDELKVRAIGPVIINSDTPTVRELTRRILRAYRSALESIQLPKSAAVVRALNQVDADVDRSLRELRASLTALRDLLEEPASPWGRQVVGGLRECIAHVLTRLELPAH